MKPRQVQILSMPLNKVQLRIDLIKARIDILKLKANDHDWVCYVPDNVKTQLERSLLEIDKELEKLEE